MREEFYDIYREIDEEYSRQRPSFGRRSVVRDVVGADEAFTEVLAVRDASLAVVDEVLAEVLEDSPVSVRPDAVHFLRVNLHQMVAKPLFRGAERSSTRLHPGELKEDLMHDTRMILREAARAGGDEVSGHEIVNALSRSWTLLRVAASNIWG